MINEISLSYEICEPPSDCSLFWRHFISLVNRDYGELIAKTIINQQQKSSNNQIQNNNEINNDSKLLHSNTNTNTETQSTDEKIFEKKRKKSLILNDKFNSLKNDINNQKNIVNKNDIIEEENAKFLQQIRELQKLQKNKRPKRQVKVIPNFKKVCYNIILKKNCNY